MQQVLNRCWAYIDLGISNDKEGYRRRLKFVCDEFEVDKQTFNRKGHRGVIQVSNSLGFFSHIMRGVLLATTGLVIRYPNDLSHSH